jgi:hypothetical protein
MKSVISPKVTVKAQGHLLTVTPENYMPKKDTGGSRRRVVAYSGKSRKRLLELFARLRDPGSRGYRYRVSFLTLTTLKVHTPKEFKKKLFVLLKRFRRKYPRLAAVWRLEFQKRGAPHVHLVLYNAPWLDKAWIQESWSSIVVESRPFTRIERVKSHRSLLGYVSKYVAKDTGFNYEPKLTVQGEIDESRALGRCWGVFCRHNLPFADEAVAVLPLDASWWLIRRFCTKLWEGLDEDCPYGFTVFCDDPYSALKYIYKLSCDFRFATL